MPGRIYNLGGYRYGFNGKENDSEVKGDGNQQDYGMRVYDPRVGKFLSVDPLTNKFPWYTPYQFSGNNPINYIDLDGAEPKKKEPNYGKSVMIGLVNTTSLTDNFLKQFKTLNNNWIGKSGNIQEGLAYISSLQNDMAKGTQLTNVVFNTHGGFVSNKRPYITAFISDPFVKESYIFGKDIQNFMNDPNSVNDAKKSAITSLKGIFDNMADGGNFVFSVCNLGKDDNFGKALQELSGGRINIYLTPDLVRISGKKEGKWIDIKELNLQRIQDGRWPVKDDQNYQEGFILFPKGFGEAKKLNKNITLQSVGDKPVDLKTPVPKK